LTFFQQIGYIVLFLLSFSMGYDMLTKIHMIGLLASYFLNVASLVTFLLVIDDTSFKHWR